MKRMKKAMLLPVRRISHRWKWTRPYYWAEKNLYELRAVCVMPSWYYRWLYNTCLWLVTFNNCRRLADRAMHTIPYQVRFEMA
jgi:hypothetical protein